MKIAFVGSHILSPIPCLNGGAVEFLVTIFLENYEENNTCEHEIFVIQKKSKTTNDYLLNKKLSKTTFINVDYNKRKNIFHRIVNKFFRIVRKKQCEFFISNYYYNNVFKEVKKINPDLIVFENYKDPLLKEYIRYFGKNKIFIHVHNDFTGKIVFNFKEEFVGLIAVSNFIKESFLYNNGGKRIVNYVLPNCANEQTLFQRISDSERLALRKKIGFEQEDFVVVYCGRLVQEKGVLQLIQAILATPKNIKLLIIGDSENIKNNYIKKINRVANTNPKRIKFTGYIKNEELYKYYQCADLQVVPTLIEEAAGIVAIEGQMSGLPLIITKSGGMVEYVTPDTPIIERNNHLVENLTKQIYKLSVDKATLKSMSENARQNALKYTQKIYYENFMQIVESIKRNTDNALPSVLKKSGSKFNIGNANG